MVTFDSGWPRKKLSGQLIWSLAWIVVTTIGLLLTPSSAGFGTHTQLGLPSCAAIAFFDRPCFGCGLTTSFTATLHLDFVTAWNAHPLGTFLYSAFTISAILSFWGWLKQKKLNTNNKPFNTAAIVFTVIFVIFGLYRFATTKVGSEEYAWYKFQSSNSKSN